MISYLKSNPSIVISTLSLFVALLAFIVNRKTSKLNSYNQKACYNVFLIKKSLLAHLKNKYDFNVKIFPSVCSNVIPFDFSLRIRPYIGGVYRTQIFSTFDNKYSLGINRTLPKILFSKPKGLSPKKYANKAEYYMSSSPLFPYACASGKFDENTQTADRQLNRYHFYIEITDYCNNIEIWYMSFSLLLSNIKEGNVKWRKCNYYHGYEYYTFNDINIVSPKDIPKNLDRANIFNKSLEEIVGKKEKSLDSFNLIKHGFDKMEYDFQLYEMKEYVSFLKKLHESKLYN